MSPTRTIDKVLKLLAKAETTTAEEADALIAKATELMVRDEIDEAMLANARGTELDEIITHRMTFSASYAVAHRELFFEVGRASGFRLLQSNNGRHRGGTWIGFKKDIARAEVLLTSLLIQQKRAVDAWVRANPPEPYLSGFEKGVRRRSHMIGFADGVGRKMREARREAIKAEERDRTVDTDAAATPGESSVALVLRSKESQLNDWYDERYGKLKSGRATQMRTSWDASSAGVAAGRAADIGSSSLGSRKALGR